MRGFEGKILLEGKASVLSVVYDKLCDDCSIAIADGSKPKFKYISKELYDLLVKELVNQEHK